MAWLFTISSADTSLRPKSLFLSGPRLAIKCADTHRNLLLLRGWGRTWTRRHQHEPIRGPAHPLRRDTSPSRLSRAADPSARAARSGCNSRPPQPASHTWSQTVPGPVALSPSHTPSLRGDVQVGPWKQPPGTRHPGQRSSPSPASPITLAARPTPRSPNHSPAAPPC